MQGVTGSREWGRIAVPMAGLTGDAARIAAAATVAEAFEAELAALFAPPDPAELSPWLGESFGGGMSAGLVDTLADAAREGGRAALAAFEALPYPNKRFEALSSPIWRSIAIECRLADLVVFDDAASKGSGPFAETFEQALIEERAAVLVTREPLDWRAPAVVAWDGSDGASRAARRAVPLLRRARQVVIAGAPVAERPSALSQLKAYYDLRGITAEVRDLPATGADTAAAILELAGSAGAGLVVAGAFGRSRLREFIFGGATRVLLQAARPSLFLAH